MSKVFRDDMTRPEPYIELAFYDWEEDPNEIEDPILVFWVYTEWPDGSMHYFGWSVAPCLDFKPTRAIEVGQQKGLTTQELDTFHDDLCRVALEAWNEMEETPYVARHRKPGVEYSVQVYPKSPTFHWQKPDYNKRIAKSGQRV